MKDKVKRKFKDTKVGKMIRKVGGGVLSEASSIFIPVVGHKVAERIDKATNEANEGNENYKKTGHLIVFAVVAFYAYSLVSGKNFLSKTDFVFLLESVRNVLGL